MSILKPITERDLLEARERNQARLANAHMANDLARARLNNPHHNGTAQTIRRELERAGEPLSIYKLELATGFKSERVRMGLVHLAEHGGIVSFVGPKGIKYYALYKDRPREDKTVAGGEFAVAGKITHGRGAKWWAGLV